VDGRAEITAADRDLALMLRRLGKPVSVAVNKADTGAREDLRHAVLRLGIADVFPVSAEHGTGVDAMLDHVTTGFPCRSRDSPRFRAGSRSRSSGGRTWGNRRCCNALTGQERAIVSPVAEPRATRSTSEWCADGVEYVFVDTAGIRRKGKTHSWRRSSGGDGAPDIRMSHVVLLCSMQPKELWRWMPPSPGTRTRAGAR
jgi:GTP-binding protein